ncbi:MAG: acyltransferase [Bacteroidales bacterium]|nr:acyltransferase [Bacteroidales bacterium]
MTLEQFEDIRSYTDEEIPAAMDYFINDETSLSLARLVLPDRSDDEIKDLLKSIKTTDEFQRIMMTRFVKLITSTTMKGVDTQGFNYLEKNKAYLFTGNHRDITLDAFILQMYMLENGLKTCNIAYGSNLILNKTIDVFGKSNKMFKVERSQNVRELAQNSQHLSDYIRYLIRENKSVWIAQRNGRTKDGNDKTDHGLISMFMMSGDRANLVPNLVELNITPIATSYEYEPCAMMKARESYLKERDGVYVKKPMEDMDSIVSGIRKKKGTMNIAICPTITYDDLKQYEGADKHEIVKAVSDMINERIYANYRLYPNNYIAYDWLSGTSTFKKNYTQEDKDVFKAYCDKIFSKLYEELGSEAEPRFTEILLGIYAIPVENKLGCHFERNEV